MAASLVNCTTAYDAYGRPQQVVTPEGALLGAAAVGLVAYGIGENNHRRRYDRYDRYDHRRGYSRAGYARYPYGYRY